MNQLVDVGSWLLMRFTFAHRRDIGVLSFTCGQHLTLLDLMPQMYCAKCEPEDVQVVYES